MRRPTVSTPWLGALVASFTFASGSVRAGVVDTFETPASATGPLAGLAVTRVLSDVPGALGLSRSLTAGGVAPDGAVTISIGGGSLEYAQIDGLQGNAGVSWNFFEDENDLATYDFDLTEGGTINAFEINVLEQSIAGYIQIGAGSACPNFSCYGSDFWYVPLDGPGRYLVPFADSTPPTGLPADLTHVYSFGFSVSSLSGSAPGTIRIGAFSTVPEPREAVLLLCAVGVVLARMRSRAR